MYRILTADIGGTNCRLGLFVHEKNILRREHSVWLPTRSMPDTNAVLDAMEHELHLPTRTADALVLAVAGPVLDPLRGATTNAGLSLDLAQCAERLPKGKSCLINDFTAQAYACLTQAGEQAQQILPHETFLQPDSTAPRGIVGAGTGCGTATLVRDTHAQWLAIPAEAGHAAFAFAPGEESEFARYAEHELGYPFLRADDVLTGRGLSLLHHFLEGVRLRAPEVAARALQSNTPTLRWYARWYGRMCRNWILSTLCRGGLYIAGGIAARNPLVVTSPAFAQELHTSPHFADMLRATPVKLVNDEEAGLWGAAFVGSRYMQ